jgi:hypothetical protein
MKNMEKIIRDNQEEFMTMVINFINEKVDNGPKKAPKTVCFFTALGKVYNSKVFKNNYEEFLMDLSKIQGYGLFKKVLRGFIKESVNEFSDNTKDKSTIIRLYNGGYVSTYSSTEKKMDHINELCKELSIKVNFNVQN